MSFHSSSAYAKDVSIRNIEHSNRYLEILSQFLFSKTFKNS